MLNKGRKPLVSLCEEIVWDLQTKKHEPFFSLVVADRFNIEEEWVDKYSNRFEYVRNATFDYCKRTVVDAIEEAAPEKSKNFHFLTGFAAGFAAGIFSLIVFFNLFMIVLKEIDVWFR